MIITLDETFSNENHLIELKESVKHIPLFSDLEFKKPEDFFNSENVKNNYKQWFLNYNENKQLGKVINVWPKENTLGIDCFNQNYIKQGDYLCLIKFQKGRDILLKIFKVDDKNLKDYKTNKFFKVKRLQ